GTDTTYRETTQPACPTANTSACPLVTYRNYDGDGNAAGVENANGYPGDPTHATVSTFDALDRKVAQAVPRQTVPGTGLVTDTTTWADDPVGNTTVMTKPAGERTAYSYDADNRL